MSSNGEPTNAELMAVLVGLREEVQRMSGEVQAAGGRALRALELAVVIDGRLVMIEARLAQVVEQLLADHGERLRALERRVG
jgi:hypothetical protein